MTEVITQVITIARWLTPVPEHASGRLVVYGNQPLIEANAHFRGYDLAPYRERCGVSALSPADLGKIYWLRPADSAVWYGPCLAVDVSKRTDFYGYVTELEEVAEIPRWLAERWGAEFSLRGEVFVGACPPGPESQPLPYTLPPLELTHRYPHPSFYPYPAQQRPTPCGPNPRQKLIQAH